MVKLAMILAAGFGTRLKPLTDNLPKAMVKHRGSPMILNVIRKLSSEGINKFIINTHHHHEKIKELFNKESLNLNITLLTEKEILGTGGALKNAKSYLENSENFLVYNTDVDSNISITEMYNYHLKSDHLATIAVQDRDTSRPLFFDRDFILEGRKPWNKESKRMAFCGIHIISDRIFKYMPVKDKFDIIDLYIKLSASGNKIIGYDISKIYWKDIGTIANLEA